MNRRPKAKFCYHFISVKLDQYTKKKKKKVTSGHVPREGLCQIEKAKQKDEGQV